MTVVTAVGQRILEYRRAYGFSIAELAKLANLSPKRVGELEQGGDPTMYEVTALGHALAVDSQALLNPTEVSEAKRSVARFRAPLGVGSISAHDIRLLAVAAEVSRICTFLLERLGRAESPIVLARRILPVHRHPEPWRQGYDLGEQARARLAPGGNPIESVQASFERLGIHVAFVEFESDDIEAASLYEPGAAPIVLLNARSDRVKWEIPRRAILAHELCHLLHDAGERDLLASISREEDHAPIEMRANGFAPSFLAPKTHVAVSGSEPKARVLQLADGWGARTGWLEWTSRCSRARSLGD